MKEHEFTLMLTADSTEAEADKLYGTFDDGTISTIAGVPQIHFHREAGSLEEAIRSAIGDVRATGFDVARVEMIGYVDSGMGVTSSRLDLFSMMQSRKTFLNSSSN